MGNLIGALLSQGLAWLVQIFLGQCSNTASAWSSAWHEPVRGLRSVYLVIGVLISLHLIPDAFNQFGWMGGVSYVFALYKAMSDAVFFRAVRVGTMWVPLGWVAPIFIFLGVAGSKSIEGLIGEAKSAAFANDLSGAIGILLIFFLMSRVFRRWRSGNPYD